MYTTNLRTTTFRRAPGVLARPLSSTPLSRGILSKDRDDTLDPNKEATDTTGQAKNPQGETPAQKQAQVVKDQSGTSGAAQTQNMSDSELTEKKKKGEVAGKKHGEEAVNPAVKGGMRK